MENEEYKQQIHEKLAKELYNTYCIAVGGIAFNGDPLPEWELFRSDRSKMLQSEAWVKVAETAFTSIIAPFVDEQKITAAETPIAANE